ncbi:hypothetical protein IU450_25870 [Nocardia abscessus]|uniref:hypothetical protein n=1 Tax=Nocardia abscessus TaxID=120957 RepID=UPI00189623F4|nr:hypothetical protein [Nocardia abscessus]MBF6339295.1 hypothetical protein [Nocardia abscessus]
MTRRATSFEPSRTYQQSLQFELIEEVATPNTPERGRAVRISTRGTVLDTARLRRPFVDGQWATHSMLAGRFTPDGLKNSRDLAHDHLKDNGHILENFAMTIQPATPSASSGVQNGKDWILGDYSPITHNEAETVSTSTTIGASVGFFGDVPTAGLSYAYTSGASWTLKDYELVAAGGTTEEGPWVSWSIKRSQDRSDPDLAHSALSPHFEAVFHLGSSAATERFSAFNVLTTVTVDKATKKVFYLPLDYLSFGWLIPNRYKKIEVDHQYHFPMQFVQSYVIDWDRGKVDIIGPDISRDAGALASILAVEEFSISEPYLAVVATTPMPKELHDPPAMVQVVDYFRQMEDQGEGHDIGLMFELPVDGLAGATQLPDRRRRFRYRGESPVGTLVIPPADAQGVKSAEIAIPTERLGQYYDGFNIDGINIARYEWIRPRRSVIVDHDIAGKCAVWIAPRGFRGGVCSIPPSGPGGLAQMFVSDLGLPEVPDAIVGYYKGLAQAPTRSFAFWRDCLYTLTSRMRPGDSVPEMSLEDPVPLSVLAYPPMNRDVDCAYSFYDTVTNTTKVVTIKDTTVFTWTLEENGNLRIIEGESDIMVNLPRVITTLDGRLDAVIPVAGPERHWYAFGGRMVAKIDQHGKPIDQLKPFEQVVAEPLLFQGQLSPDYLIDAYGQISVEKEGQPSVYDLVLHTPSSYIPA